MKVSALLTVNMRVGEGRLREGEARREAEGGGVREGAALR